jgi:hypothetical protein
MGIHRSHSVVAFVHGPAADLGGSRILALEGEGSDAAMIASVVIVGRAARMRDESLRSSDVLHEDGRRNATDQRRSGSS